LPRIGPYVLTESGSLRIPPRPPEAKADGCESLTSHPTVFTCTSVSAIHHFAYCYTHTINIYSLHYHTQSPATRERTQVYAHMSFTISTTTITIGSLP